MKPMQRDNHDYGTYQSTHEMVTMNVKSVENDKNTNPALRVRLLKEEYVRNFIIPN